MITARFLIVWILISLIAASLSFAKDLPVNERIMYGGLERTPEMLEAARAFLKETDKLGKTREEASDHFVRFGWGYLDKGNVSMAAKRFNQAWLLKPDNYRAYWAFGVLAFERDNHLEKSTEMFERALSIKRHSGILSDYGRISEIAGRQKKAIGLFEEGLVLNPKEKACYIGLIRSHAALHDWDGARRWIDKGEGQALFTQEEVAQYRIWISESEKVSKKQ